MNSNSIPVPNVEIPEARITVRDFIQGNYSDGNRSGSWGGINESDEDIEKLTNGSESTNDVASGQNACQNLSGTTFEAENNVLITNADSQSNCEISIVEKKMRRRLRFFFMTPHEKWAAKSRLPWKLLVQVLKVIIVTTQVAAFASQRYNHVGYLLDTRVTFAHLFIKDWDVSREVDVYPPSSGPLALYKIDDFYSSIDYAVFMFTNIETAVLGPYVYDKINGTIVMPKFCFTQYANLSLDIDKFTYTGTMEISEVCIDIPSSVLANASNWSIKQYLANSEKNINFNVLHDAKLTIHLRTITLTNESPLHECYKLSNVIYYDNRDHDGQMLVLLDIDAVILECAGYASTVDDPDQPNNLQIALNISSVIICSISFLLCSRSLYRAQRLKYASDKFFNCHFGRNLTSEERFEFMDLWYVLICISDFFAVFATIIKMTLEEKAYEGFLDKWNYCALLLGIAILFGWFGCLRYLGLFSSYNVLILTIKKCVPNVIRFSVGIIILFIGFCLSGSLVLGPYNLKFRSFSSTIECLFSLINGDDMFATFATTISKDPVIWWFSRIYLYSFISLFIYVILSLFIAIIMDSYDTIKRYYEEGFPVTGLKKFAMECDLDPYGGEHWDDQDTSIHDFVNYVLCCCPRARQSQAYQQVS